MLLDNQLLNHRTDLLLRYIPLSLEEIPHQPGYLCAIDAEFVIMSTVNSGILTKGGK
jgi:PAB-dependent poly(A)-specific ribonuclease subunit 2